jgi:hypothetical protein
MSEAHEKTRIRQLEDAAAHWEHKYVNARQYNRNLEERCQKLEAALREVWEAPALSEFQLAVMRVMTIEQRNGLESEHADAIDTSAEPVEKSAKDRRIEELEALLDWARPKIVWQHYLERFDRVRGGSTETPVSTLCAICDQIKELHPATHPWTAKETPADASYRKTRDCEHHWVETETTNWERCSKCRAARLMETPAEAPPSFRGWIQKPCENCGKLSTEHRQPEMLCYEANRQGKA